MFNYIVQFYLGGRMRLNYLELPLAGVILMMGVATSNANPAVATATTKSPQTQVTAVKQANPRSNGIYLYGQSAQPEQIGQEYLVFEVNRDRVIGAFYMPRSEFSCFQGTIESQQLRLTMQNSDLETADAGSAEGQQYQPVATASTSPNVVSLPVSVTLKNYHPITTVSANDREIINACKASYQEQMGNR